MTSVKKRHRLPRALALAGAALIAHATVSAEKALDVRSHSKVEIAQAPTALTILRDKNSSTIQFRQANDIVASFLATKTANYIPTKEIPIETQLGPTTGHVFKNNIILVSIFRSGNALLPSFQQLFQNAKVGVIGLERNEETAVASKYYEKLPAFDANDDIILLDPMLATGGSAVQTIKILLERGAKEENIIYVGVVSAEEGVTTLLTEFPNIKRIITCAIDEVLNDKKYIVPGLGDYGDRYFGTEIPVSP